MLRAVADTHAIVWYLFADPRLGPTARDVFDAAAAAGDEVAVASITLAEIVYLEEKGRLPAGTFDRLYAALEGDVGVLVEAPFDRHVARALRSIARDQVPDLPDRIIAATALVLQVPLVTRDGKIRLSEVPTIW